MKKTLVLSVIIIGTLIFASILLCPLIAASMLIGNPHPTSVKLGQAWAHQADSMLESTPSQNVTSAPIPEEELNYYMERHNVQDEGYEMVVAFANGKRHNVDVDRHVAVWNVGRWENHCRQGTALALDSLGRTIVGTCRNDSLFTGLCPDTTGIYLGDYHEEKAEGHGAYIKTDGGYFEGHWENGLRQGFGVELWMADDGSRLRVGEWSKDRFMGERMKHTSKRIYGIDIARYQHGRGRRPVAIQWKKLRITHVGKRGSDNVSGTVDYPVSFVYIKSTEGTTVRNKFYLNDYTQARKHGISTGAYHFWSVRRSGAEQAKYFISNTLFRNGDLPPVLDIEPSKAQIELAGGAEKMFQQIRIWLNTVERWTGVKPILYVNQLFVNNYLSQQPDLKRDYRVWIARYSEYKPDVRLTYWQLCSDGRVAGIQGNVDINVFNGYQNQFEAFLEKETIKR